MILEISRTLTNSEISKCEHLSSFHPYELYFYDDYETYIVAIDNSNLICGCFEFCENEEEYQLAHMYVLKTLIRSGIGTAIILEAVKLFGCFALPSTNKKDTYYYIENGLPFIHHCFDIGALEEPPFKRPGYFVI